MSDQEIEKAYSNGNTIEKLERLVRCMKENKPFEIQLAGKRIYVPVSALFNIEYEQDGKTNELEFQFTWKDS